MKKIRLGDKVVYDGALRTVVGFNDHGTVVLGHKDWFGNYYRVWVSKETLV